MRCRRLVEALPVTFARSRTRVLLLCSERLPVAWESRDDGLTEEKRRLQDDTSLCWVHTKRFSKSYMIFKCERTHTRTKILDLKPFCSNSVQTKSPDWTRETLQNLWRLENKYVLQDTLYKHSCCCHKLILHLAVQMLLNDCVYASVFCQLAFWLDIVSFHVVISSYARPPHHTSGFRGTSDVLPSGFSRS